MTHTLIKVVSLHMTTRFAVVKCFYIKCKAQIQGSVTYLETLWITDDSISFMEGKKEDKKDLLFSANCSTTVLQFQLKVGFRGLELFTFQGSSERGSLLSQVIQPLSCLNCKLILDTTLFKFCMPNYSAILLLIQMIMMLLSSDN